MTEQPKKINLGIQDGNEFFAHELSVNYNPTQFIFDFRCVTPRSDPRSKDNPFLSIKHNVVLVDTHHAKRILEVLQNVVSQYEKQFGKIEKPKALKMLEKKAKKSKKEDKKTTKEVIPSYLG